MTAVLAQQALPGDVIERRHHLRHLCEHLADVLVGPVQADAIGDSWISSQSCRASPGGSTTGRRDLHLPVGVGEGAPLLGVRGGRQHDVGMPSRLGQEDVLHDEMLELRQRLARMLHVGVGHGGVLAHHVHALDLVVVDRVHDLDHGQSALGIERRAPEMSR